MRPKVSSVGNLCWVMGEFGWWDSKQLLPHLRPWIEVAPFASSRRQVEARRGPAGPSKLYRRTHFRSTHLEAQGTWKAEIQHLGGVGSNRVQSEGIGKIGIGGIRRQESSKKRGWGCQGDSRWQFWLRPGSGGYRVPQAFAGGFDAFP